MKTVLIIDDVKDVAEGIEEAIVADIEGVHCTIELDFAKSLQIIRNIRPDAIVLDLMKGAQSSDLPGEYTWRDIWNIAFCPIVIYTGWEDDIQPRVPENHPFVKRITKGGETLKQVVNTLRGFEPAITSVNKLRTEVDEVIRKVLRDTAGDGHLPMSDPSHLLHAVRRRIAATMDDSTITDNRAMASWEQYLIPAMGESPLTGDLLRKPTASWEDPTAYRLVLTPSCDLVKGRCEPTLIAARCESTARLIDKLSLSCKHSKLEANVEKVKTKVLTPGVFEGFVALPGFPSHLPLMVANLKDIEVIECESIGSIDSSTHEFVRVASIDSPFREQVAWAYLTTAARPGMPDRDLKAWAEEIVKASASAAPPNQMAV